MHYAKGQNVIDTAGAQTALPGSIVNEAERTNQCVPSITYRGATLHGFEIDRELAAQIDAAVSSRCRNIDEARRAMNDLMLTMQSFTITTGVHDGIRENDIYKY